MINYVRGNWYNKEPNAQDKEASLFNLDQK